MIIHVDMDAFYASVEIRDRPELAGKPVVVGGSPDGRGVVAAASYEARKYGVHSAMPAAQARRLCPNAVFLRSRIDCYAQVSREIREIFQAYTPLVEPLSLDEAFLDVTGSERLFGPAETIARQIKADILRQLRLVASTGVAPNKFLAKIASDLDKPDGFVVVRPDEAESFLEPLAVERIWGVGRQGSKTMHRLGVRTIGDLKRLSLDVLEDQFGSSGEHFWRLARGIDNRPVVPDREAKSISHETTFETDIADATILRGWLFELTDQVGRRLRRLGLRGGTAHIKVRFADFRTITRSQKLSEPTNTTDELFGVVVAMLETRLPAKHLSVRLLGMGVSDIDASGRAQGQLFDEEERRRQRQLDEVADQVKDRFGTSALGRGTSLQRGKRMPPHQDTG
jgi:DNA polymerase-4